MTAQTELVAKAQSWRFTAAEKLRVLREAGGRTEPGELSAPLRLEGLYSSHLAESSAADSAARAHARQAVLAALHESRSWARLPRSSAPRCPTKAATWI